MATLTVYLLDREQLQWARLYRDGATETGRPYRTPPGLMNQTVFTAALTGSLTRPAGTTILNALQLGPDPGQILTDHAFCYPPADPTRPTVLEPLYPDRLAEDFLALTLPGHSSDYPAQLWAPGTATMLITRDAGGTPPAYNTRALTFLAAAAAPGRWSHVSAYLNAMLTNDPALAIDAGGPALAALAEILDISVLEVIESLLPADRNLNLDTGAAAVTNRVTLYRLPRTTDLAQQARLHTTHAQRLANAGLRDEALEPSRKAVAIYRSLADTKPDEWRPFLASSLTNLGIRLAELGKPEEAFDVTQEATTIWRGLAKMTGIWRRISKTTLAYESELATSLTNLGRWLSEMGKREPAVNVTQEAARIWRRLAAADPASHEPALATTLTNLSIWLTGTGKDQEALKINEEALQIWQRLTAENPATHEPAFAATLNNLADRLSQLNRNREAADAATKAVEIRRRLAKINPAAFEPDLASTLSNLGADLSEVGRYEEALAVTDEALEIRRRLASQNPAAYELHLAQTLSTRSQIMEDLRRHPEAMTDADKAIQLWQRLATENPAAHRRTLDAMLQYRDLLRQGNWK